MISELILKRILSRDLILSSDTMRAEILEDTTPVPVFGNYKDSKIVTVGINPSSKEFPSGKDRRLIHLSDVELPPNYYQLGLNSMSIEQATIIENGLVNYFLKDPYWGWFDHPETAIKIGFEASYKSNDSQKSSCHLDIFPWATTKFSGLNSKIQSEFCGENLLFMDTFLTQGSVTDLVILGSQTFSLLKKQLGVTTDKIQTTSGPYGTIFESGSLKLGQVAKQYFYTSKGPSAQFDKETSLRFQEKNEIHIAFGKFIKEFAF